MYVWKYFLFLVLVMCLLSTPAIVTADNEAIMRGTAIAEEADRRASGFQDSEETFTMLLRDKRGRERVRTLRIKSLEMADDGDRSLTIFDKPADVKGTAMLSFSHGIDPDDQWLYLPALKRVKRISSKNRSGPFMGSEFSFEDMSSFELEKYNYLYLRDEPCGELICYVSEWTPNYENSGYSRIQVWHDQEEYRIQKFQYYDKADKLEKTLSFSDYKLYQERFWRAILMEMVNHKTGKSTILKFNNIKFGVGLTARDFDQNSLKRAR